MEGRLVLFATHIVNMYGEVLSEAVQKKGKRGVKKAFWENDKKAKERGYINIQQQFKRSALCYYE